MTDFAGAGCVTHRLAHRSVESEDRSAVSSLARGVTGDTAERRRGRHRASVRTTDYRSQALGQSVVSSIRAHFCRERRQRC